MSDRTNHRLFAWFWDRSTRHESARYKAVRAKVAGGARGRVLELGVGVGTNWAYLPEGTEYVGIEPDEAMVKRARAYAAERGIPVDLRVAAAEDLPFPDDSFDTIICTLTLCSVSDVPRALAEVRRVLRAGGEFRFWEHVRPEGRLASHLFDWLTPVWRRVAAGCHPNRRTVAAIEAAGFEVQSIEAFRRGGLPFVVGVALHPGPAS